MSFNYINRLITIIIICSFIFGCNGIINSPFEKNNSLIKDNSDVNIINEHNDKIVKTETVMKSESLGTNLSNSLSIEKFGLETLLFKKLESDRKFAKQLEDEKSELLHMMYTQKKLFERVNNNKFSFKNFNLFSKAKIYYIYLPIVLAYYIAT